MVSFIYFIIDLAGMLLLVNASKIFPFEDELCDISLVFHIILWFFSDTAIGIVLQSPLTTN